MKKEPQFRELKFKSQKKLNIWLEINTAFIIELYDFGQDMLKLWIHETGEILHCNAHGKIYIGKFVNLDVNVFKSGSPLEIYDDESEKWKMYFGFGIENITATKLAVK